MHVNVNEVDNIVHVFDPVSGTTVVVAHIWATGHTVVLVDGAKVYPLMLDEAT